MRLPFTQDPMTGDLHKHHTEQSMSAIRYIATKIEHTLVFNRSTGEQVNLCVDHFYNTHEVTLAVFNVENGEPTTLHEEITLSYQEARLLRDLLNRPEVQTYLDQDFQ